MTELDALKLRITELEEACEIAGERAGLPELDRKDRAIGAALDFIRYHPAVRGDWPMLVELLQGALTNPGEEPDDYHPNYCKCPACVANPPEEAKPDPCPECKGYGSGRFFFCPTCKGSGTQVSAEQNDSANHQLRVNPCPECGGSGERQTLVKSPGSLTAGDHTTVLLTICPTCKGSGRAEAHRFGTAGWRTEGSGRAE